MATPSIVSPGIMFGKFASTVSISVCWLTRERASVRFCAFKEGVPNESLWGHLSSLGFRAVFTQCPTYQKPTVHGIGRIQIDDDDHNIFLTKISKTYLFFKDKRSWDYIRKFRLDRVGHHISENINFVRDRLDAIRNLSCGKRKA